VTISMNPIQSDLFTTKMPIALKSAYDAEYFDIAFPTNQGQALDTALANFFAGKGSNSTIINSVSSSSGH